MPVAESGVRFDGLAVKSFGGWDWPEKSRSRSKFDCRPEVGVWQSTQRDVREIAPVLGSWGALWRRCCITAHWAEKERPCDMEDEIRTLPDSIRRSRESLQIPRDSECVAIGHLVKPLIPHHRREQSPVLSLAIANRANNLGLGPRSKACRGVRCQVSRANGSESPVLELCTAYEWSVGLAVRRVATARTLTRFERCIHLARRGQRFLRRSSRQPQGAERSRADIRRESPSMLSTEPPAGTGYTLSLACAFHRSASRTPTDGFVNRRRGTRTRTPIRSQGRTFTIYDILPYPRGKPSVGAGLSRHSCRTLPGETVPQTGPAAVSAR